MGFKIATFILFLMLAGPLFYFVIWIHLEDLHRYFFRGKKPNKYESFLFYFIVVPIILYGFYQGMKVLYNMVSSIF